MQTASHPRHFFLERFPLPTRPREVQNSVKDLLVRASGAHVRAWGFIGCQNLRNPIPQMSANGPMGGITYATLLADWLMETSILFRSAFSPNSFQSTDRVISRSWILRAR